MKKIKKIAALLLAMAMVMGMSLTAFATEPSGQQKKTTATITVLEAGDAELSYVQVIKGDRTTKTGWAFVNQNIEQIYLEAFEADDAQAVIETLIAARNSSTGYAETAQIAEALAGIIASDSIQFERMTNPQTVNAAGVYAIKAEDPSTTEESSARYNYSAMAAYIGFDAVEGELYPSLQDVEITAKKSEIKVEKENTDADKIVGVGDIVTFTIKTNVPPVDPTKEITEFYIYDTISGADFYLEEEDATAKVEMAGKDVEINDITGKDLFEVTGNKFKINLSSLVAKDNSNRDKEIVVTYTAKINGDVVESGLTNKATAGNSSEDSTLYGEDTDKLYTGIITLKKVDLESKEGLAGATFHVQTSSGDDNTALFFIQKSEGVYIFTKDSAAVGATKDLVVASDGTLTVKGLDANKYYLAEMVAPEGYSRIIEAKEAEIKLKDGTVADSNITCDSGNFDNTKLSSLPSTGGIGTTIFTIGGCLIMIVAAGLFFATRRKSAK